MSINPKTFDREYYHNVCFGSEEFKTSGGRLINTRVKTMIDTLKLNKSMDVLEIGCGRGDTAIYIAKKVRSVTGIDYSRDGIKIAKGIQNLSPKSIQNKTKFYVMDASKLLFKSGSYDIVLLIDTLDHLNNKEQLNVMREINRVLKSGGELFIRTCSNKILLSYCYKYYVYPMNRLLTWIDKKIKRVDYASLPQDPRPKGWKKQHVSEPSYFSLRKLFEITNFEGKIKSEVGFLKGGKGLRTYLYNFAITFYPISKYFPLNILFTGSFVCYLRKK